MSTSQQRSKSSKQKHHPGQPSNFESGQQSATHNRGYSMEQQKYNPKNIYNTRHQNMMVLKSHNDGVSNFTKGATLPQHPNSTSNTHQAKLLSQ